jgi:hypothetical protein
MLFCWFDRAIPPDKEVVIGSSQYHHGSQGPGCLLIEDLTRECSIVRRPKNKSFNRCLVPLLLEMLLRLGRGYCPRAITSTTWSQLDLASDWTRRPQGPLYYCGRTPDALPLQAHAAALLSLSLIPHPNTSIVVRIYKSNTLAIL